MKPSKNTLGGFTYFVPDEKLLEYLKLPIKERLRWLGEANAFLNKVAPKNIKLLWEKFRKGEL